MAGVPITFQGMMYPRDKSGDPYPFTALGIATITGLTIGGGPILPPDQVPPVDPPAEVWPPDDAHPEHPIVFPPDLPPEQPPPEGSTTDQVHAGWNFNDGKNPQYPNVGWYYVYIPGPGDASPKRPKK